MTIPLMETGNSGSDTNFLHIGRELEEIKFKLAEMDNGLQRALIEQAGILKRLSNVELIYTWEMLVLLLLSAGVRAKISDYWAF